MDKLIKPIYEKADEQHIVGYDIGDLFLNTNHDLIEASVMEYRTSSGVVTAELITISIIQDPKEYFRKTIGYCFGMGMDLPEGFGPLRMEELFTDSFKIKEYTALLPGRDACFITRGEMGASNYLDIVVRLFILAYAYKNKEEDIESYANDWIDNRKNSFVMDITSRRSSDLSEDYGTDVITMQDVRDMLAEYPEFSLGGGPYNVYNANK